ncbi:MAG: hypothetical protein ACOYZ7_19435 [Chloroflexota bacterium]
MEQVRLFAETIVKNVEQVVIGERLLLRLSAGCPSISDKKPGMVRVIQAM